jgi:hypothetical protein
VTKKVLWRYLSTRTGAEAEEPLFPTVAGRRMTNSAIRLLLTDLGSKAGIINAHPHRLRHTFAVEYLRNEGDIFTLQMILGTVRWIWSEITFNWQRRMQRMLTDGLRQQINGDFSYQYWFYQHSGLFGYKPLCFFYGYHYNMIIEKYLPTIGG